MEYTDGTTRRITVIEVNISTFNQIICVELHCANGTHMKIAHPALEGTTCGEKKVISHYFDYGRHNLINEHNSFQLLLLLSDLQIWKMRFGTHYYYNYYDTYHVSNHVTHDREDYDGPNYRSRKYTNYTNRDDFDLSKSSYNLSKN